MASGVVWLSRGDMKMWKSTVPEGRKNKAVLFCLNEDKATILEEGTEVSADDRAQNYDTIQPNQDCHYAR